MSPWSNQLPVLCVFSLILLPQPKQSNSIWEYGKSNSCQILRTEQFWNPKFIWFIDQKQKQLAQAILKMRNLYLIQSGVPAETIMWFHFLVPIKWLPSLQSTAQLDGQLGKPHMQTVEVVGASVGSPGLGAPDCASGWRVSSVIQSVFVNHLETNG